MNRFFYSLLFKGYDIEAALRFVERIENLPQREFRKWQIEKSWEIYNFHINNNPFYLKWLEGQRINSWDEIPPISKKELRTSDDSRISLPFRALKGYQSKTSGSSGSPFSFKKDRVSHAHSWAAQIHAYGQFGIRPNAWQARFYAIPLEVRDYYKEFLKDWLAYRKRFIVHDLSEDKLEGFVHRFRQFSFDYIYGYSNSILTFAKYLSQKRLVLKGICPSLSCCIVTSEVCTEDDRVFLQKTLGVPIFNEYGSSEFGVIAIDNQLDKWRILGSHVLLEVLDENKKPVEEGQIGRITVTSLFNKAMPFIRYQVGDMGSICTSKETGRKLLRTLDGRENEMVFLPSGRKIPGFTLYYVIKSTLKKVPEVLEYNIHQISRNKLKFYLVLQGSVPDEFLQNVLEKAVRKYLNEAIEVSFEKVSTIDRTLSGKTKHFVNHLLMQGE